MKQEQNNNLSMMQSTMLILTNFSSAWSANAAITAAVIQYQTHLTAIMNADQLQKTSTIGTTQTKEAAKESLIANTLSIASAGIAYAAATNNLALKASCKIVASDLEKAKDNDLTGLCQNVHDAVNTYIASMASYGATVASLAAMQTSITNFSGMVGKPRAVQTISIDATVDIDQHLRAAKTLLEEQLDTLLVQFQSSSPHFHNQYRAARIIVDYGHRKTVILKGYIYDIHNHVLKGALVTMTGTATHKKFSKLDGSYKFSRLHTGTYTFTVSINGFVTQTKTVTVSQNGTVQTDFVMVAVAGGGTNTNTAAPASA